MTAKFKWLLGAGVALSVSAAVAIPVGVVYGLKADDGSLAVSPGNDPAGVGQEGTGEKAAAKPNSFLKANEETAYGNGYAVSAPKESPGEGYGPWSAAVITVSAEAPSAFAPYKEGTALTPAQLLSAPAGTAYTIAFKASVDGAHTGEDVKKETVVTVVKAKIRGIATDVAITDAVSARFTAGSGAFRPMAGDVRDRFRIDDGKTTFKIVKRPATAALDEPAEDTVLSAGADDLQTLANLSAGYMFRQVSVAVLTDQASANYSLEGEETLSWLWVVDATPVIKDVAVYEGISNFGSFIANAGDIAAPVFEGNQPWRLESLTPSNFSGADLLGNEDQLNAFGAQVKAGGVRLTVNFVSEPPAGKRGPVARYAVRYSFVKDATIWRLTLRPGSTFIASMIIDKGQKDVFGRSMYVSSNPAGSAFPVTQANIVKATLGGKELARAAAAAYFSGTSPTDFDDDKFYDELVVELKVDYGTIDFLKLTMRGYASGNSGGTIMASGAKLDLLSYASGKVFTFSTTVVSPSYGPRSGSRDGSIRTEVQTDGQLARPDYGAILV